VNVTNPDKVLFPGPGYTKRDLVEYYLAVAEGALRGAGGRPNMMVRYPDGIEGEFFYQKRAPKSRPPWIEVARIRFPSGRSADEVVPRTPEALAWMANLGCLELHPHPVRTEDLDHPDELRIDLDPVPGVKWKQVREVALTVRNLLEEIGLIGFPKTSGKRGMHVYVRIEPRWGFDEVRRARARARGGAPRTAPCDQQVVEGGAPRRLRRLQPECQGPHHRLGLLGAPHARGHGLGAARLEGSGELQTGGLHPGDDEEALRPHRRSPLGDRQGNAPARCFVGAFQAAGRRRRAVAALLPEKN
jgi:DNA ligase D-like protein (predicted polymerase)